jgi:hypothetical protein
VRLQQGVLTPHMDGCADDNAGVRAVPGCGRGSRRHASSRSRAARLGFAPPCSA